MVGEEHRVRCIDKGGFEEAIAMVQFSAVWPWTEMHDALFRGIVRIVWSPTDT